MVNDDISTGFVLDEEDAKLGIHNNKTTNRTKITANEICHTSFSAKLDHVQYGKWNGEDAVLIGLSFHFRFPNESRGRFTDASVRLTLKETKDSSLTRPEDRNYNNDPHIVLFAPQQVLGTLTKTEKTKHWTLTTDLKAKDPANVGELGVGGELGGEDAFDRNSRMRINGYTDSDDDHHEDNEALWNIKEDKKQESGILHDFPAAIVALLPKAPQYPVKITGHVKTSVAFSLNPMRLVPTHDEASFLDRKTGKGQPVRPDLEFSDANFPWAQVVNIPKEYEVSDPWFQCFVSMRSNAIAGTACWSSIAKT